MATETLRGSIIDTQYRFSLVYNSLVYIHVLLYDLGDAGLVAMGPLAPICRNNMNRLARLIGRYRVVVLS